MLFSQVDMLVELLEPVAYAVMFRNLRFSDSLKTCIMVYLKWIVVQVFHLKFFCDFTDCRQGT